MLITMKALKDFRGRPGEGRDRMVEAGNEFKVENESRATDLETRGLAVAVVAAAKPKAKMEQRALNKMEPRAANKAADTGPLASPGGKTGGEIPSSSSPPAQAPKTRRSRTPKGGLDL